MYRAQFANPKENKNALVDKVNNLFLSLPKHLEEGVVSNSYRSLCQNNQNQNFYNVPESLMEKFRDNVNPYVIGLIAIKNLCAQNERFDSTDGKIGTLCLNINVNSIFENLNLSKTRYIKPTDANNSKLNGMLYMVEVLNEGFEYVYDLLERNGAVRLGTETDCQFIPPIKTTFEEYIRNLQSTGSAWLLDNKCVHFAVNKADEYTCENADGNSEKDSCYIPQWLAAKRNLYTFTWLCKESFIFKTPFIVSTRFCEDLEQVASIFSTLLYRSLTAEKIKVLFVLESRSKRLNERLFDAAKKLAQDEKYLVYFFRNDNRTLLRRAAPFYPLLTFDQKRKQKKLSLPVLKNGRKNVEKNGEKTVVYEFIITPIGVVHPLGSYDASITMPVKLPNSNTLTSIEILVEKWENEEPFAFGKKIVALLETKLEQSSFSPLPIQKRGNEGSLTSQHTGSSNKLSQKPPFEKLPLVVMQKPPRVISKPEETRVKLPKVPGSITMSRSGSDPNVSSGFGAAPILPTHNQPCSSSNPSGQSNYSISRSSTNSNPSTDDLPIEGFRGRGDSTSSVTNAMDQRLQISQIGSGSNSSIDQGTGGVSEGAIRSRTSSLETNGSGSNFMRRIHPYGPPRNAGSSTMGRSDDNLNRGSSEIRRPPKLPPMLDRNDKNKKQ